MKVIIILFILLLTSASWAETYRWVDDKGTEHFTNDRGSIPKEYRDQVKELKDEPSTELKKDEKPQKTLKKDAGKETGKGTGKARPEGQKSSRNRMESDAVDAFQAIVSHWKGENFEALYQCGTQKSRAGIAKENFVQKMKKKSWGLAPSWETVQNIETEFKSPSVVYITAKVGYKPKQGGNTKGLTEVFEMKLENGQWRTDLSKILQAPSGAGKTAHR